MSVYCEYCGAHAKQSSAQKAKLLSVIKRKFKNGMLERDILHQFGSEGVRHARQMAQAGMLERFFSNENQIGWIYKKR